MSKKSLTAQYGQLVDDRFLGNWNEEKAAALAEISAKLDECDQPKIAAMRKELAAMERKGKRIEVKLAKSGSNRPQTKTAGVP